MTQENSGDQEVRQQCDSSAAVNDALYTSDRLEYGQAPEEVVDAICVLAAEVRRLRERHIDLIAKMQTEHMQLQSKLRRVEALLKLWRRDNNKIHADELEAALRD